MKALLVRVGIDQSYGAWNAPVDAATGEFVYVPIPEALPARPTLTRRFHEVIAPLERFCGARNLDLQRDLGFPHDLRSQAMHLDPDFEHLTYGDDGANRGAGLVQLVRGDLLVFYAGLRELHAGLLYSLVGLLVVDEVVMAINVPSPRWHENAHTRREKISEADVIVRGRSDTSGRLSTAIPIGEYRDRAYRVRNDLLESWGGLRVKDGFIQRSARPPTFLDAAGFLQWFDNQAVSLVQENN